MLGGWSCHVYCSVCALLNCDLLERRQLNQRSLARSSSSSSSFSPQPALNYSQGMAHSTPTLPLELPPYTLIPLLTPVFPPLPSTSRPTSPSKLRDPPSPQRPASSRFGQLVSSVAAGAGTVAAAAGSVAGAAAGATEQKPLAVRGVEAGDQRVWVGASDGRIRVYDVREEDHPAPTPTGLLSPPGSPGDGRRTPVKQVRSLSLHSLRH